jgi:hypothetical protein
MLVFRRQRWHHSSYRAGELVSTVYPSVRSTLAARSDARHCDRFMMIIASPSDGDLTQVFSELFAPAVFQIEDRVLATSRI